jgi:hypothetical protein
MQPLTPWENYWVRIYIVTIPCVLPVYINFCNSGVEEQEDNFVYFLSPINQNKVLIRIEIT